MGIEINLLQEVKHKETLIDDLQTGIGKNSWYLKLPLVVCRHLFKEDYGYTVHAFACACGEERVVIAKGRSRVRCRCRKCGNAIFFDLSQIEHYDKSVLRVDANAECFVDAKRIGVRAFIVVPVDVELAAGEKIRYAKRVATEITLTTLERKVEIAYRGKEKVADEVLEKMETLLWRFVARHYFREYDDGSVSYVKHMSPSRIKESLSRLLRYPGLKHGDFLFWVMDDELYHNVGSDKSPEAFLRYIRNDRSEKSLKRALYKRYKHSIAKGRFCPLTPYVVCRVFRDPNFAVRLLEAYDFALTRETRYQSISLKAAAHGMLIDFLKTRYGEKRLVKMFETMRENDTIYWEDSVEMFSALFDRESIADLFRSVKADVREIHDELVRCAHLVGPGHATISFEYTEAQTKPCGIWQERFEIVLPKDSGELYLWAKTLHNCLYGYVDAIRYRRTTVYGIKENGTLLYAAEIRNDRIVQLRGAYNVEPDEAIRRGIEAWFRTFFDNDATGFV